MQAQERKTKTRQDKVSESGPKTARGVGDVIYKGVLSYFGGILIFL